MGVDLAMKRYIYRAKYSGTSLGLAQVMAGDAQILILPISLANELIGYDCLMGLMALPALPDKPLRLVGPGSIVVELFIVISDKQPMMIDDIIGDNCGPLERIVLTKS